MKPEPKGGHPLAINILKFQRYNFDFFSCEEVVFFEYMMVKGMSFKATNQFYHSSETIRNETGIGKHALNTIIKRFEELGILQVEVKGMPRVKYFKVDFNRVSDLVRKIYRTEGPNNMLPLDLFDQLYYFIVPLAEEQLMEDKCRAN